MTTTITAPAKGDIKTLNRTAFVTGRALEYFTEKHLIQQIGDIPTRWPRVLLKELLDNALDACESAIIAPEIAVTIEDDALIVEDNGPGLPLSTIENSLDYAVRVSDKSSYVSPSRGQLGNALKCVWAAPFVVTGKDTTVKIHTGELLHTIIVTLDRIGQKPVISHTIETASFVKNGTILKMYYTKIASYLGEAKTADFYKLGEAHELLNKFALFNPHASFTLYEGDSCNKWTPSNLDFVKWNPSSPTSPHWYYPESLRNLIASYIADDLPKNRKRTVRELVSEFAGLSGSAKQRTVSMQAGMIGAYLADFVVGHDIEMPRVKALLKAMQDESRAIKPSALGILGESHLSKSMESLWGVAPGSVFYKKAEGVDDGLPFVIEVALGILPSKKAREDIVGVNHSATFVEPLEQLSDLLAMHRVDCEDPICTVVNLVCPRLNFKDTGKSKLHLWEVQFEALEKCVKVVTSQWAKEKRSSDRNNRVSPERLNRLRLKEAPKDLGLKEAAYQVMEAAYLKASGDGASPANARQIMYAARPDVLLLTGGKCWKKSSYFTQGILKDFVEDNPELTENWDIVFDARGKFVEPHTGNRVDLGTVGVRQYLKRCHNGPKDETAVQLSAHYPTMGPANRFHFALFLEKEGFNELLESAQIANRYDIAIMSTKGMSVTAARTLVQELSDAGVTILVLRDFDKSGFSIVHTLRTSNQRFKFKGTPRVVDLGLRLEDVESMQLDSESVEYDDDKDPRENLRQNGATEDECDFLVTGRKYSGIGWVGKRVELNAMTSPQFIKWVESKLEAHGVEKMMPDSDTLKDAYRRAWQRAELQKTIDAACQEIAANSATLEIPDNLQEVLAREIKGKAEPWDNVLFGLVGKQRDLTNNKPRKSAN
jgi:hypothetical protein